MPNPFQTRQPYIEGNPLIRTPQQEAYNALSEYAAAADDEREVGVVLPVGCGKAGCITLAPFAFRANRALVIAPGTSIAGQLLPSWLRGQPVGCKRESPAEKQTRFPDAIEDSCPRV